MSTAAAPRTTCSVSRQSLSHAVVASNDKSYLSYQPGSRLIELAATLSSGVWHERSFAVRIGRVYANRFLLTVDMREVGGNAREKILDICTQLRMPASHVAWLDQHLSNTRYFALGFEQGTSANVYKAYLEQMTPADTPSEHFGFKWDAANPDRHIMTRYIYYPGLSLPEIQSRVAKVFEGRVIVAAIAQGLIGLSGKRMTENPVFLEVDEPGNTRRSFDLNFYPARLQIADIEPFLSRMWDHYRIEPTKWQPLFQSARNEPFGHFSGGIHRRGEDFFTVYYGRRLIVGRPRRFLRKSHKPQFPTGSVLAHGSSVS